MSRVCKCYLKKYLLLVLALALAAGILIAPDTAEAAASKEKKDYGVFLSIDSSQMKKLYPYRLVVIDAQFFSAEDIRRLQKKGVDGFFIDNCDVYDYAGTKESFEGLVRILRNIRSLGAELVINGGDVFVTKYRNTYGSAQDIMTAVNQESVWSSIRFEQGIFGKQTKEARDYFSDYVKQCQKDGMEVYLLEYTKDKKLIRQIRQYCRKNKFRYYISDSIELD